MTTGTRQELEIAELQTRRMGVLKDLAEIGASSLGEAEVAHRHVQALIEKLGAKGVFLWAADEQKQFLLPLGHAGVPPAVVEQVFGGPVSVDSETLTSRVFRTKQLAFFRDAETDPEMPERMRVFNKTLGFRAGISLPLVVRDEAVGSLSMTWAEPKGFDEDELGFLESAASEVALGLHNARLFEQIREKDLAIRQAYTDVIEAVTGGKLLLMTHDEINQALGEPVEGEREVVPGGIGDAVRWLRQAVEREFPALRDAMRLVDPAGEAITNAIEHAGGGSYQLYRKEQCVQLRISDRGPGIDFSALPKATLVPGYSSVGTLGLGFNVMLKAADRVLLATQPGNTTLVLEFDTDGQQAQPT